MTRSSAPPRPQGPRTSARGRRDQSRGHPRSSGYQPRRSGRSRQAGGSYLPWLAAGLVVIVIGALATIFWSRVRDVVAPPRLSAQCGVVVDASGSGANFDPKSRLDTKLPHFLQDQKCGYLDFIPLNGLSDASHCKQERLDLDPPVGIADQTRSQMRDEARARAAKLLDCARQESSSSDVLGALRKVADVRTAGQPYRVLMVSDMLQNITGARMTQSAIATRQARQQLINHLAAVTPDLSGVIVFPTDMASSVKSDQRRVDTESFWTELFATDRAGHPQLRESYV